ncbi:MAG: NYN domain-containing protein [bacterium]|nr:MAG: NYN domain-containing protein [bacterium]
MRILIDGYNLIRHVPELAALERKDLEEGRDHLVRELAVYQASRGHRIWVVFDAGGSYHLGDRSEKDRGVRVIYSGQGRSADEVIAGLCREHRADLVVTADRDLSGRAEREGVPSVPPQTFWEKVETEKYRRLKGLEEEEDRDPDRPRRKLPKKARKRRNLIDRL